MIRIGISGAEGRMGRALYNAVQCSNDYTVVFGVDTFKQDDLPYPVFDSFDSCSLDVDVVVDFSNPSALDGILQYGERTATPIILATTGYSEQQLDKIKYTSKNVAIFHSSNMSIGVNLMTRLAKDTASFLGDDYDIEIVETHHNKKVDAPSGTALSLAKAINGARENNLDFVFGRGNTEMRRSKHEIGLHAVRGGSVVGKHSIMFLGAGEMLSINHEAESKEVFVSGALRAIDFILSKKKGLYGMADLIECHKPVMKITAITDISLITIPSIDEYSYGTLLKLMKENCVIAECVNFSQNTRGNVALSFAVKHNSNCPLGSQENLFENMPKNIKYTIKTDLGKIFISATENNTILFDALSVLKSVGAKTYMIASSERHLSFIVDKDKLVDCETALKSYFNFH